MRTDENYLRLIITLTSEEYRELQQEAEAALRTPQNHARWLIVRAPREGKSDIISLDESDEDL